MSASMLYGKVAVRRDGDRWVTSWHGLAIGTPRSREYEQRWPTWRSALDCANAIARTWELSPQHSLVRATLVADEANRWMG